MNDQSSEKTPLPLSVKKVVKRFGTKKSPVTALKEIDFQVADGEFVAVMGSSGSGKSTLLHAVAGLTDIDSGCVQIAGQDLSMLGDRQLTEFRRRHIGLVFQSFNLIRSLNAEDNSLLPTREFNGLTDKFEHLLERLGLEDRRHHKPGAMSGGEQQRVAIARALISDPSIVLADEPTGSLDSVTGQSLCQLLRQLCDEQNRTIVVVTHEPTVAAWADRAVVLKDGQVLSQFKIEDDFSSEDVSRLYQKAVNQEVVR